MDFYPPSRNTICKRVRYYTGFENPLGFTNGVGGVFPTEDSQGLGKQIIGGRVYLCSLYAYVLAQAADVWIMVYDCSQNTSISDLGVPRLTIRIPQLNQPDTVIYECAESEADEVTFEDGKQDKVGAFFENGIRIFASSTGDRLTPYANWGFIPKCDMVTLVNAPGKVV